MSTAEATVAPSLPASDRAFLGHPKGLGFLAFVEGCERFSYYSMQTLLVLYMVNYLLVPGKIANVVGLGWLQAHHYGGLEGQPLSSAVFGDYSSLVYLTPILGGLIADRWLGRRMTLILGGLVMALGHFLMAFEGSFILALLTLIVGVGLFKGNIASQVGELYSESDVRRATAFQIFYIAINVSVIVAPLISGTLGENVGWHWGFGAAGVVMVLGLVLYLAAGPWLPPDNRPTRHTGLRTLGTMVFAIALVAAAALVVFFGGLLLAGIAIAVAFVAVALTLSPADRARLLALALLVPVIAVSLLTNQEIFNAYIVWGDQHFALTFFGHRMPTSWLISADAFISSGALVGVTVFWAWWGKRGREPDELGKMIIGSLFVIAGGLCLVMAAATQGAGKIGLFWPLMFHVLNSIGFSNTMPVSLALFSRFAPRAITAFVIGIYYLAFFASNKIVGIVGGWYSTMATTQFWLLHVASAVVGLAAFVLFRLFAGRLLGDRGGESKGPA